MRGYLVGILLALGVLGAAAGAGWLWLTARATSLYNATLDIPLDSIAVPADSASLVEGERAAWFRGCHGCHGDSLQGKVFLDEPWVLRLVAPNVTTVAPTYSDAELARLIRHGVTRTGRPVVAMPSATFYHLDDGDVGRIIAHLRRMPARPNALPSSELRLLTKIAIVQGEVETDAGIMDHNAPRLGDRRDTTRAFMGQYLAQTICSECHGMDLRGDAPAPSLVKALGYTRPQFVSLMLDGRSRDGRDLGLMATTARRRFVRFTRDEIDAIWDHLQAMPFEAPAPARP